MNAARKVRSKCRNLLLLAATLLGGTILPAQAQELTYIRMLHGLVGGPKIDFYLDGDKKLNDQTFGNISKYLRLPNGYHRFEVRASEPPLFSPLIRDRSSYGQFFTVVPYGSMAGPRLLVLREDGGRPMREWMNKSRVFVCHLSPGTRPLNIRVSYGGGPFRPMIRSLRYGRVKAVYVPAGTATVQVRVGTSAIRTMQVNMRPGRRHTMFLIGRVGATGEHAFKLIHEDAASQ